MHTGVLFYSISFPATVLFYRKLGLTHPGVGLDIALDCWDDTFTTVKTYARSSCACYTGVLHEQLMYTFSR